VLPFRTNKDEYNSVVYRSRVILDPVSRLHVDTTSIDSCVQSILAVAASCYAAGLRLQYIHYSLSDHETDCAHLDAAQVRFSACCPDACWGKKFRAMIAGNNNLKWHKYVYITTDNQALILILSPNPNPYPNSTTKQHAIVNIQLNSHMSYVSR